MAEFETLIDGLSFAEGPRWHEGRLYFSDMYAHRVLAVGLDGVAEMVAHVPERPSAIRVAPPGFRVIYWC